jgi:TIR domain-containing protein
VTAYQIAVFSNGADHLAATLRQTLLERLGNLGIDPGSVSFLDTTTVQSRDPKAPIVGAFLSLTENPVRDAGLAELVQNGELVVPVVEDCSRFNSFVFDELRGLNGVPFRTGDPKLEEIASVLLEGLSLLRRSRRLFISYRRAETQSIAIQLYETLDRHGFDVFLDTHSVRPGEPFQDVLWHRLADTDVIVLLDSPGFASSRWTEEELARANSTNIQTLQLIWPTNKIEAAAAFSRALTLASNDFVGDDVVGHSARLHDDVAEKVVTEVESLRARALASRHTYLVQEFCGEATRLGLSPHMQPQRFITLELRPGVFIAAVPTVGVPDAIRYQEIENEIARHPREHAEVVLLYDERGIREKWIEHLDWLDKHKLRVRSIQVSQSGVWLEKQK